MKIFELIEDFSGLIQTVETIEYREEETVSKIKLKLNLIDATILWVREVQVQQRLIAYSYYWLRKDNSIIIGWDNAPHHPEISTFPHHRHIGNKIDTSEQRNLRDVLIFIQNILLD